MSPHGVRSRRGVACVSSVGASVAARSARCSRWLSRTVRLLYSVPEWLLKDTLQTFYMLELLLRLSIVHAVVLFIIILHLKLKGLKT